MRSAFALSRVNTYADRPYGESFASRTASSSVRNVMIGSMGPNVSSRMMAMSCVTFVSTVGWTYLAPSSVTLTSPPASTFAPRLRASSRWRRTISTCICVVIAPTSTSLLFGSPCRSRCASATTFSVNGAATLSCT